MSVGKLRITFRSPPHDDHSVAVHTYPPGHTVDYAHLMRDGWVVIYPPTPEDEAGVIIEVPADTNVIALPPNPVALYPYDVVHSITWEDAT